MLTMYLDESLEADEGYAVVAGFVGNDIAWNNCIAAWRSALALMGKESLHMTSLRGWKGDRNKELLRVLGAIPENSGLVLAYSSVKFSDYSDLVKGTLSELVSQGYLWALYNVVCATMMGLPDDERLEVIWEQQSVYSGIRESMFKISSQMPEWNTPEGIPRLAKWSSMAKSTILEPSDYACYALLQQLRDPSSNKAKLCSPILRNPSQYGLHMTRDQVRSGLKQMMISIPDVFAEMTIEKKKELKEAFRQAYKEGK